MLSRVTEEERKMTRIGVLRIDEMERRLASKALAFGLVATLMALIMLLAAKPAYAVTFVVNSTGDSADQNTADGNCDTGGQVTIVTPRGQLVLVPECTLRAAIQQANASSLAGVTNVIDATGITGTINLGSDLPELTTDIDINGPGAGQLTVQGNNTSFDIFTIGSRGNISAHTNSVSISGLTATGGKTLSDWGAGIWNSQNTTLTLEDVAVSNNHADNGGGGIANYGTLTLTNSTVSNNTTGNGPVAGLSGGIENTGTLTITNSTISGNSAFNGGGIGNGGILTMTNTTVSGNTASSVGGGITNGSGGTATLTNVTINGNTAGIEANVRNFGPPNDNTEIIFKNTIVANPQGGGANCGTNTDGVLTSAGHNLSSDASCGFTANGDKQNQNPLLGNLANNGGSTQTHELQASSPAIDAAHTASAPPKDQRGLVRPQGTAADMGAFEVDLAPTVSVTTTRKRNGNATVQFSEPMDPSTLMQNTTDPVAQPSTSQTIVLLKGASSSTTQVPAKVNCTDQTCKTVILDPDVRLGRYKRYTVKVEGVTDIEAVGDSLAVEDLTGNKLAQDYVKSFKTKAR
jgi:CSLREA domain-containing protein